MSWSVYNDAWLGPGAFDAWGRASGNGDPAAIPGMIGWWDERTFAPDGYYATTIELNDAAAKAYAEVTNVAPSVGEQNRYFGQPWPINRATLSSYNGWRCPLDKHDDTGGTDGSFYHQMNTNVVTDTRIGNAAVYFPVGGTAYNYFGVMTVPTAMVDAHEYWPVSISGITWYVKFAYTSSGNHCNVSLFHQGTGGSVSTTGIDIFAAGFVVAGDLVGVRAVFNGSAISIEVMRADGTVLTSNSPAATAMGEAQVGAYRLVLGGVNGGSSYKGKRLAQGVCTRDLGTTVGRALVKSLLAKYGTTTAQTWPEGAPRLDPLTVSPEKWWIPGTIHKTGSAIDSIDNASLTGPQISFGASGATRPTSSTYNSTLQAMTCTAATPTYLEQLTGTEADLFPDATVFYVFEVITCKAQASSYPASGVPLAGASGLRTMMTYGSGSSVRLVSAYSMSGGPHGDLGIITQIGSWQTAQVLAICHGLNPQLPYDGFGTYRGVSNGDMQSDLGGPNIGSRAGKVRFGRTTDAAGGDGFDGQMSFPMFCSGLVLTPAQVQAIRRGMVLDAGLAV